jgi:hypothetical protein
MKSSVFWDITPFSPVEVNYQTTRRYIPEDTDLHSERYISNPTALMYVRQKYEYYFLCFFLFCFGKI